MVEMIRFFVAGLQSVANLLNSYRFAVGAFSVSILDLFVGFIALGIIISVFWKGAHT